MAPAAGFLLRVRINGTVYAVKRISTRSRAGTGEVSNSEGVVGNPAGSINSGVGFEAWVALLSGTEIQVESATFDPIANPFQNPIGLAQGVYLNIRYFPVGIAGVSFLGGSCLVSDVEMNGDVTGLQPVSFTAKTDGAFLLPNV